MDLAVLIDKNMVPGLHAALYSALAHWDLDLPLTIHLFHKDLDERDIAGLEKTLSLTGRPFCFKSREFTTERLAGLKPFHGSLMAYGVLLLADLLPDVSSVLYIDSDLIFTLPFSKFLAFEPAFASHHLSAALASAFDSTLDRELARSLELDLNAPYFNSGMLVLNLDLWRRDDISAKCLQFCRDHHTYDQTALNFTFYNSFFILPREFNFPLYANSGPPANINNKIFHFVGSPKPFDFLGNVLNVNSGLFNSVLAKTVYADYNPNAISPLKLRRILTLRRSYARVIRDKLVTAISGR